MSRYFPTPEEHSQHTIFPGVNIHTCGTDRLTLSVVELAANSVVEEHAHPHDQIGFLISGRLHFFIGDEDKILGPGDTWCIPGGVQHKVITLDEPARAIDVFTPRREEYM